MERIFSFGRLPRALLLASALLLTGGQRQDELVIKIHVVWTFTYKMKYAHETVSGDMTDQITITYDGLQRSQAPAGTNVWDMNSNPMSEQVSVSGGGSGTVKGKDEKGAETSYSQSWTWVLKDFTKPLGGGISMAPDGIYSVTLPGTQGINVEPQIHVGSEPGTLQGSVTKSIGALLLTPRLGAGTVDANNNPDFLSQLNGHFDPSSRSFSKQGSATASSPASATSGIPGLKATTTGTEEYNYSFSLNQEPQELEAILVPDKGYEDWIPSGSPDGHEDSAGDAFGVTVQLRDKNDPKRPVTMKATFTFQLLNISSEPGVSLNAPPKAKVRGTPDMAFEQKLNGELNVTSSWQSSRGSAGNEAKSKQKGTQSQVFISSFDYGGWATLKVYADVEQGPHLTAHLQEKSGIDQLLLPKDDNGNHIADTWEKNLQNPNEEDDEDALPKGDHAGDTLSNYEEYRGFMVQGGHVRTDPNRKDVFIDDRNKLGLAYFPSSGLNVHVVEEDEYEFTQPSDPQHQNGRVINFNHGFANLGDAHVLLLINGPSPYNPAVLGHAVNSPGPPGKIPAVYINKAACMESRWGDLEVQSHIAHELSHACNVPHHGDGDYEIAAVWKLGPDNKWYPIGTPPRQEVAIPQGELSGSMQCIMRHYRSGHYVRDGGRYRWKDPTGNWVRGEDSGPADVPGTTYCTGADGNPPNARIGPAAPGRGDCSEKFCVNDLKH